MERVGECNIMNDTKTIGHFYHKDGRPCHEVPRAKGGGMRPTHLGDARKMRLKPSVTTILRNLNKPALTEWLISQAVMAVMTAPRMLNESIDDFVHRVLVVEKHQDQERDTAAKLGKDIHHAIKEALEGKQTPPELQAYIGPVVSFVKEMAGGSKVSTETVVVSDQYAGTYDALTLGNGWLIDYKSAKNMPEKASWPEHRLQLSAYANGMPIGAVESTGNLYISTRDPGKFVFHKNPDWRYDYDNGFRPLLAYWIWSTNYNPALDPKEDFGGL